MPVLCLASLTGPAVRDLPAARTVAMLPTGAIEARGPHLRLGTDVIIAEAMASACSENRTFSDTRSPSATDFMERSVEFRGRCTVSGPSRAINDGEKRTFDMTRNTLGSEGSPRFERNRNPVTYRKGGGHMFRKYSIGFVLAVGLAWTVSAQNTKTVMKKASLDRWGDTVKTF